MMKGGRTHDRNGRLCAVQRKLVQLAIYARQSKDIVDVGMCSLLRCNPNICRTDRATGDPGRFARKDWEKFPRSHNDRVSGNCLGLPGAARGWAGLG